MLYFKSSVSRDIFSPATLFLGLMLVLSLVIAPRPAESATVEWTGVVANTCVVTLNSNGLLGVSVNGQAMSSDQTAGQPASVAVMSTGPNVVTFGSPAMTLWAPSYTGSPIVSSKQQSNKGHSSAWMVTAHQAAIEPGDTLFEVHAQLADAANAFPMGAYKVSSEVTCAPAN